jgi:hypothetical protein
MVSSLQTLERIVEKEGVDDLFRREFIWKGIALNLFGCLAGAGGAAYSVSSMCGTGIDFGHGLLGGISLTVAGFSAKGLHKALRTRRDYLREMGQGVQPDPRPYLVGGRVSRSGTAVERSYGFPIEACSSLGRIAEFEEQGGLRLGFLDHVIVSNVSHHYFETTEFVSTSEGSYDTTVKNYSGHFSLERLGERDSFSYFFRGSMDAELDALLSRVGDEVAFVFRPVHYYFNSGRSPFAVERLFHPHP